MSRDTQPSPVSFVAHVARLPKNGLPVHIEADQAQRAALARGHGLEAVNSFRATLVIVPWKRNGVRVEGRVEAEIVQSCVISLDPVASRIDEAVEAVFLPEDSRLGREGFEHHGEIVLTVDGPDSPETFAGDTIDVGALAEEFFGLAIDPYPRSPGAHLEADEASEAAGSTNRFGEMLGQKLQKLPQKGGK